MNEVSKVLIENLSSLSDEELLTLLARVNQEKCSREPVHPVTKLDEWSKAKPRRNVYYSFTSMVHGGQLGCLCTATVIDDDYIGHARDFVPRISGGGAKKVVKKMTAARILEILPE